MHDSDTQDQYQPKTDIFVNKMLLTLDINLFWKNMNMDFHLISFLYIEIVRVSVCVCVCLWYESIYMSNYMSPSSTQYACEHDIMGNKQTMIRLKWYDIYMEYF